MASLFIDITAIELQTRFTFCELDNINSFSSILKRAHQTVSDPVNREFENDVRNHTSSCYITITEVVITFSWMQTKFERRLMRSRAAQRYSPVYFENEETFGNVFASWDVISLIFIHSFLRLSLRTVQQKLEYLLLYRTDSET